MLIFKIIACVIVGFIGFYAFLESTSLDELKSKATNGEKKSLERIELIAMGLPLLVVGFIVAL